MFFSNQPFSCPQLSFSSLHTVYISDCLNPVFPNHLPFNYRPLCLSMCARAHTYLSTNWVQTSHRDNNRMKQFNYFGIITQNSLFSRRTINVSHINNTFVPHKTIGCLHTAALPPNSSYLFCLVLHLSVSKGEAVVNLSPYPTRCVQRKEKNSFRNAVVTFFC